MGSDPSPKGEPTPYWQQGGGTAPYENPYQASGPSDPYAPYGAPVGPLGQQFNPGYPPAQYPPYGSQYPGYPTTNGLAIAALVVSLISLTVCGAFAFVGAIMGHMARKQIRLSGEKGDELALAAVIVGWAVTGLLLAVLLIGVVAFGWSLWVFNESVANYDTSTY